MKQISRYIGLIPARKGSKGIKNKNLLKINKLSLVERALRNISASKKIEEIYLSSDSFKILEKASKFSKVKTHLRSKKFAKDSASSKDVIEDFIKKRSLEKRKNISIVYLQPSSPFNNSYHIDKAIKVFEKEKKNTLISCYEASAELKEKIFKSFVSTNQKNIKPNFNKKSLQTNRQNLGKIFIPNGAIFIFRITKNFLKTYINFKSSIYYLMKENESVDINSKKDFEKAKKIIK